MVLEAIINEIHSEEEYDALVQQSQERVVIVNLYQSWCGPCTAMNASFNKIMLDYENAKDRVLFYTCDYETLSNKIQSTFPSDTNVHLDRFGCLPLFAVYRFGSIIGLIQGVDAPVILNLVDINIPPLKDEI